jgi:hypothetical protein
MRLAKNALIIALIALTLVFTVSAQTLRDGSDPRNTAPTVGTGGPVGGPTGLFTIYDGQTLRRGEYTFSAAYSNYDRDPGNVDITVVPVSFQIGLSDNLELFFTTDAYKGIKVNSPQVLSSFYLPNSQLKIAALGGILAVPGAIVLAPQGSTANGLTNTAVYRRAGAPFTPFPFVGGQFGNNGQTFGTIGPAFGFPVGTNVTYGSPVGAGAASNFPGLGSVYGSILPGVVLSVQTITLSPGNPAITTTAPLVYSLAPSYLPDAPFTNRVYGQSAFGTYTAGAKFRFTNVENPIGLGVTAFYRWYGDKATDSSGFNQLQRGASPGGSKGDFGAVLFADARLRKWLNLSGNLGYIYNSSVKGSFSSGDATILDRPDEIQYGVGLDFPTNQFFQPILEFTGTRYVGGRTPNAFEVNPMDGIGGVRIYPKRWVSFGVAYRYNFNQLDQSALDGTTFSQNANVVRVVSNTATSGVFSTQTVTSTGALSSAYPVSSDPHGYIFQVAVGRRNARSLPPVKNTPGDVTDIALDKTKFVLPCPAGQVSDGSCTADTSVAVKTSAVDPDNDVLTYNYTVSGGRIVGQGANVSWDLSGVRPGTYTITSAVDDGCGFCGKTVTKTINVETCTGCKEPPPVCACPTISVSGPSDPVGIGQSANFTANVNGGSQQSTTFTWTVSGGTITGGQGTPAITVTAEPGSTVTATVEVGGDLCADCIKSASAPASFIQKEVIVPKKVAEFGDAKPDQIKAQLDNFFIELNNDPNAKGYIINYGTKAQKAARIRVINQAIAFRKFDKSRIVFIDGGDNGGAVKTELWVSPAGADAPTPGM